MRMLRFPFVALLLLLPCVTAKSSHAQGDSRENRQRWYGRLDVPAIGLQLLYPADWTRAPVDNEANASEESWSVRFYPELARVPAPDEPVTEIFAVFVQFLKEGHVWTPPSPRDRISSLMESQGFRIVDDQDLDSLTRQDIRPASAARALIAGRNGHRFRVLTWEGNVNGAPQRNVFVVTSNPEFRVTLWFATLLSKENELACTYSFMYETMKMAPTGEGRTGMGAPFQFRPRAMLGDVMHCRS